MSGPKSLTAAYLRSLTSGPKLMWYHDFGRGSVTGLRLGVTPKGAKVWSVRYTRAGQRKTVSLGAWPAVSLARARELARSVHLGVANGEDPAAAKTRDRLEVTLAELAERVHREHYVAKRKPRTAKSARTLIDSYIAPALGKVKISELTTSQVSAWHAKIGRKHPGAANRALSTLSCMCTCALRWNLLRNNPCRGVERFGENSRERYLSDDEYGRIHKAIESARRGGMNPIGLAAIEFVIYTGLRAGSVTSLRWEYIDFERGALDLPDSKGGQVSIPLNEPARQVLEGLPRGSEWVFPGRPRRDGTVPPISSLWAWWPSIVEEAGLEGVRIHDLRHAYASVAARSGATLLMISKLLGHKSTQATERYAHLCAMEQLRVSEEVGARIVGALPEGGRSGSGS